MIWQGVFGVMAPLHVYPVPGTIWPIKVEGKSSLVIGFWARRFVPVHGDAPTQNGRNKTGGFPPQFGSNRSKLNAELSPLPHNGVP